MMQMELCNVLCFEVSQISYQCFPARFCHSDVEYSDISPVLKGMSAVPSWVMYL